MKRVYGLTDKGDCIFFCRFDLDYSKSDYCTQYSICRDCGQRLIEIKHNTQDKPDTKWLNNRRFRRHF